MSRPQTYGDIWIRWIHTGWEKNGYWKTGIQVSVLKDPEITKALFILDGDWCVFIPMDELRRTIFQNKITSIDSIIFEVNPKKKTVDQEPVKLEVIISQTKRKKDNADFRSLLNF